MHECDDPGQVVTPCAHAQQGYIECLVCLSVCLFVHILFY